MHPREVTTAVALLAGATLAPARSEPPRVFGGAPPASWIVDEETPGDAFGVFHLRRVLELARKPERFVVHVSADNRALPPASVP